MSPLLLTARAELYKTRHHRLPYVLTAIGAAASAAPGIYFMFRPATEQAEYTEAALGMASLYLILAGAIFGGWMLGSEYRQQTIGRVVATGPARPHLLAAKAIAGVVTLGVMSVVVAGAGLGMNAIAAAMDGSSLDTTGLGRVLASGLVPVAMVAVLAYAASAVFRSDTYATLTALAVPLIFGPFLAGIPKLGDYTLGEISLSIQEWVGPDAIAPYQGAVVTVLAAAAWLLVPLGVGVSLFARRDL